MKPYPSITILTATFNSNVSIFRKVMDSVGSQDYPKKKLEHFILDGGSTNVYSSHASGVPVSYICM